MKTGTYEVGPDQGTLLVQTAREGAAARMGHDLTISAARWTASITLDDRRPGRTTLSATIDASSLTVQEGSGGALPLITRQYEEIEATIREKVLEADRYERITFRSTAVDGDLRRATMTGRLSLHGVTRPVALKLAVRRVAGKVRVSGSTRILQSDFGIKPYSALMGALRVKDAVDITVDVALPA